MEIVFSILTQSCLLSICHCQFFSHNLLFEITVAKEKKSPLPELTGSSNKIFGVFFFFFYVTG